MTMLDDALPPPDVEGNRPPDDPFPPPSGPPVDLRVTRSDDRVGTGVAAGLAEAIGVPAVAVRIAFVLLAFLHLLGVLLYAAGWLLLPAGPGAPQRPLLVRALGWVVLAVAAVVLVAPFDVPRGEVPVALLCLGVGVALWQHRRPAAPRPRAPRDPSPTAPTAAPATVAGGWWPLARPAVNDDRRATRTEDRSDGSAGEAPEARIPGAGDDDRPDTVVEDANVTRVDRRAGRADARAAQAAARRAAVQERRERRAAERAARPWPLLVRLVLAAALAAGAVGLLAGATAPVTLGAVAAVLGAGAAAGSFVRRGRWLVLPGAVSVLAAVGSWAVAPLDLPSAGTSALGWVSVDDAAAQRLSSGVGDAHVDLRGLDPAVSGGDVTVRAVAGAVRVYARDDQRLVLDLRVGAGYVTVDGAGERVGLRRRLVAEVGPADAPPARVTVVLGAGQVEVTRQPASWFVPTDPTVEPGSTVTTLTPVTVPVTVPEQPIPAPAMEPVPLSPVSTLAPDGGPSAALTTLPTTDDQAAGR